MNLWRGRGVLTNFTERKCHGNFDEAQYFSAGVITLVSVELCEGHYRTSNSHNIQTRQDPERIMAIARMTMAKSRNEFGGLNHTAWGKITGTVDPDRLRQAVLAVVQQHEILRTAFFDQDGQQMQHIFKTSTLRLEEQHIEDEAEVKSLAMFIQKGHVYDVARGETIRLIMMSRPESAGNYLVIGLHPLIMDATGIQVFLRWLAFHYANPHSQPVVKQFATASEQRRAAYAAGKYTPELEYWGREFPSPPPTLPLLSLSKVAERPVLRAYENITADCRIGPDTKARIAGICRQHRTTPFHFYLAALRALLLRYTIGGEDVTTAVAENGRGRDADVIRPAV